MGKISQRRFPQAADDERETPLTAFKKPQSSRAHEPKTRNCLMCCEAFLSAWSGERICPRCKKSAAWRNALAES